MVIIYIHISYNNENQRDFFLNTELVYNKDDDNTGIHLIRCALL